MTIADLSEARPLPIKVKLMEQFIPHPRIKGVSKDFGDILEEACLSIKATAKLAHMNKTEMRKFVRGFKYCKNESCLYCKPGRS